jgi:hypothetical protein
MQVQALSSISGLSQAAYATNAGAAGSGLSSAASSGQTRPSATSASTSSSGSTDYAYDVMDTNKDGYVSFFEWLLYLLTNPGSVVGAQAAQAAANQSGSQAASPSSYTRQGTTTGSVSQSTPAIDLFA